MESTKDMRDAFFEPLVEKAIKDERIVFLTGDHSAFALKRFEKECPERYYNIGIAEQNMISMAGGLAIGGKKVYIYGITPFLSIRTLEQLTIDVASMELSVSIIGAGAGFTYSTDGATHHGLQDTGALLSIPKLKILNCSDPKLSEDIALSSIEINRPEYIRIEKGEMQVIPCSEKTDIEKGYRILNKGKETVVIGTGCTAYTAYELISSTEENKDIGIIDMFSIGYETGNKLMADIQSYKNIIVYDEGYRNGLCSIVGYSMAKRGHKGNFEEICVRSDYYFQGDSREGMRKATLVAMNNLRKVLEELKK